MEELKKLFSKAKSVTLIAHKSPDGDAVGSAVGLKRILENQSIQTQIILPDAPADNISWMDDKKSFCIAESKPYQAKYLIDNSDLICCLDFNAYHRAGKIVEEHLCNTDTDVVMIDHHPDPSENQFKLMISDTSACSTAELVMSFCVDANWLEYTDLTALESLYMGIVTDSGSFRFPSVTANTHEMVKIMIDQGLEPYKVHEKIFDNNNLNQIKLRAFAVSDKLEVFNDTIAIMNLTKEELDRFNYQKGDTEGLVNVGLSINGVGVSTFFKENEGGGVKISFRSKGKIHVNQLASDHFEGGGHKYAAGGFFQGNIEQAIALFKSKVLDYV